MAGIGFKFREIVSDGTYLGVIKGYFFASIFAAGPWILTMSIIATLSMLAPPEIKGDTLVAFRAILSHVYAFSLIVVGVLQFPITRYIADRIYEKDRAEVLSTFIGSNFVYALVAIALSSVFLSFSDAPFSLKILITLLFVTVTLIWNGMVFLTAIRDFKFIIFIFLSGTAVSVTLCYLLKAIFYLNGYVLGYFLGQLYILSGMISEMVREFYTKKGASYYFLRYVKKYFVLLISGAAYNLAIWVDKFIIWNYSEHETYFKIFKVNGVYDTSVFIACLTIIPALAYFFVKLETGFYDLYKNYFVTILDRQPIEKIYEARKQIIYMVDASVIELIKVQGAITLFGYIYSDALMTFFGCGPENGVVFKYAVTAVFFHILFLFNTIFMMYFEYYKSLLAVSTLFLLANGAFTMFFLHKGYNMASGYLVASVIAFAASLITLKVQLRDMVYYTFICQPVMPAVEEKATFDTFKYLDSLDIKNAVCKDEIKGEVPADDAKKVQ